MKNSPFSVNAFTLKLIAIISMTIDHMYVFFPDFILLKCIGRIALPIFCFLISEGFSKTHNVKKYLLRLFVFAVIAEIPFKLCFFRSLTAPYSNVLFTLLIGLLVLAAAEKFKGKSNYYRIILATLTAIGCIVAQLAKTDGSSIGVLMVVVFYVFRNDKAFQLIFLLFLNWLGFYSPTLFTVNILSHLIRIPIQALAVFALIPIWLYNGGKGLSNKFVQYLFYIYYPLHLTVIWLIDKFLV